MNRAGTAVEVPAKVPFLSSLGQQFLHERTHIDRVSFPHGARRVPRYSAVARCRLRVGPGHASWASARRLYDGSRTPPAWGDRGRPLPACESGWRDSRPPQSPRRPGVSPSLGRKSTWDAKRECGGSFASTCGPRLSGRRSSAGWSACRDRISIDCSRMPEVSPDTFSVSGCSKRMRCWPILRICSRSRRSPRICFLQTPPASAVPSNVSLATTRASCGRRHSPGWRHPRRREAHRHRQEATSASLFEDFSGVTPLARGRKDAGRGNIRAACGRR